MSKVLSASCGTAMAACKEWLQKLSSKAQHPLPHDALQTWVGFQGVAGFDSWLQNLYSVPQFDLLFLFSLDTGELDATTC